MLQDLKMKLPPHPSMMWVSTDIVSTMPGKPESNSVYDSACVVQAGESATADAGCLRWCPTQHLARRRLGLAVLRCWLRAATVADYEGAALSAGGLLSPGMHGAGHRG